MNYFKLITTTPEVLEKIKIAEQENRYSDHLDPIDYTNCYLVDENFPYIPTGKLKRSQWIQNTFIVRPFTFLVNTFLLRTKVYGRKNIKGIENAVVTCNHVNKLDALAVKKAVRGHKCKVMVGDFNNQKGKLGEYMRTAGVMPFARNLGAMKSFNRAVSYYLKNGTYVLFFPEQSEWWCYEKPRPFMDGAFHYAVKNRVPVVPIFITFTKTGRIDENGIELRKFHVHMLEPIYRDETLSDRENIKQMKEKNYNQCKKKYEEFYHCKFEELK